MCQTLIMCQALCFHPVSAPPPQVSGLGSVRVPSSPVPSSGTRKGHSWASFRFCSSHCEPPPPPPSGPLHITPRSTATLSNPAPPPPGSPLSILKASWGAWILLQTLVLNPAFPLPPLSKLSGFQPQRPLFSPRPRPGPPRPPPPLPLHGPHRGRWVLQRGLVSGKRHGVG